MQVSPEADYKTHEAATDHHLRRSAVQAGRTG